MTGLYGSLGVIGCVLLVLSLVVVLWGLFQYRKMRDIFPLSHSQPELTLLLVFGCEVVMVQAFSYIMFGTSPCYLALYCEAYLVVIVMCLVGRAVFLLFKLGRSQALAEWRSSMLSQHDAKRFKRNFFIRKMHWISKTKTVLFCLLTLVLPHAFWGIAVVLQFEEVLTSQSCVGAERSGIGFTAFQALTRATISLGGIGLLVLGVLIKRNGLDSMGAKFEMFSTTGLGFFYLAFHTVWVSTVSVEIEQSYQVSPFLFIAVVHAIYAINIFRPVFAGRVSLRLARLHALDVSSLEKVISTPVGEELFYRHLQSEFSNENFDFYKAVQDYQLHIVPSSPTSMDKDTMLINASDQASKLYKMFIASGSPGEVNLSCELKSEIKRKLDKLTSKNLTNSQAKTLFDKAQEDVFNLMASDSFQRFMKSAGYLELQAALAKRETTHNFNCVARARTASLRGSNRSADEAFKTLNVHVPSSATTGLVAGSRRIVVQGQARD